MKVKVQKQKLTGKEKIKLTDKEIKEGAPFAALSYVFFLWIFTFIFKKEKYHAYEF